MSPQAPIVLASTGAVARYPLGRTVRQLTRAVQFSDLSGQFFSVLANPLGAWRIQLGTLRDDEAADWIEFFNSVKGRTTAFTFVDPWDNLLTYSEEFENAAWVKGSGLIVGKNYLLRSEEMDNAAWTKDGTGGGTAPTVTANVASPLAPDGTATADQVDFPATAAGATSRLRQSGSGIPSVPSQAFLGSIFLRASAAVTIEVALYDQAGTLIGSAVTASLNSTGWQRISATGTSGAGATAVELRITQLASQSAKTIYAWGGQLEYGPAASDYNKTVAATTELLIADPFWIAAPSNPDLASAFSKRGRQLVNISTVDAFLYQNAAILPAGSGSSRAGGLQFAASLYVKRQGSNQTTFNLSLLDANAYETPAQVSIGPPVAWIRFSATGKFSAGNPSTQTRLQIGASGGGNGLGAFYAFGAQLELDGAASRYKHNSAKSGVRASCHFSQDALEHSADGWDLDTLQLMVEEWG